MSQTQSPNPGYTEFHPRWYRPRISTWWWLQRGSYLVFILREVSSVFVAWFVLFTLMQIHALHAGKESYAEFQSWAQHPVVVVLNVISLFFLVFHAITWLNLAPKAVVVHFRGRRVPGSWMLAGNYTAWAVASAFLAWLILKG
jgi:fumarate reductase subunit C